MKNTFNVLLILLFCFYATVAFFSSKKSQFYKLSGEQIERIELEIGEHGVRVMHDTNCATFIAERLETGVWRDNWCANRYKHVISKITSESYNDRTLFRR